MGKYHKLVRVVMFAAMDYNGILRQPANWIGSNNATPAAEYYAFAHQRDASVNFTILSTVIWPRYGMTVFGAPVNVDNAAPPYNNSHILTTNLDVPSGNFHSCIAVDALVPKRAAGTPVYKPVWEYLLATPIKQ